MIDLDYRGRWTDASHRTVLGNGWEPRVTEGVGVSGSRGNPCGWIDERGGSLSL